jgi:hypothetical protein
LLTAPFDFVQFNTKKDNFLASSNREPSNTIE